LLFYISCKGNNNNNILKEQNQSFGKENLNLKQQINTLYNDIAVKEEVIKKKISTSKSSIDKAVIIDKEVIIDKDIKNYKDNAIDNAHNNAIDLKISQVNKEINSLDGIYLSIYY
jgi:hypothetical protein